VTELLGSLAATDWPMDRLHVLVGDDSDAAATFAEGRWPFEVRRLATPRAPGEAFNYAAKMNRLWRAAGTEQLVLMNDDVTVRGAGWLKALLTFSMDEDVGGVGARLVFPDGRLQHAGVAAVLGAPAHLWHARPADRPTYQDWALVHRDWSMVTGAVFATRRSVLEVVGGFDERFSLEFNDLDLCLRLRLLGRRIVCTPFAELAHREMASRGAALPAGEEIALFLNRWRDYLAADPAWAPGLTQDRLDPEPVEGPDWYF
jgi:GT2 family glycosyltransferase